MAWRKVFVVALAAVFLTSTLVWAAPPQAWAALGRPELRICAGSPDQSPATSAGTRAAFEAQVGSFISLVHNSITEGSTWNVTFDAGGGRSFTLPCEDSFDGFLRIMVPFFPDHDGIDDQDTLVTVTVQGLPGTPALLAQTPPTFAGDYSGQALAMMLEQGIDSYNELAPVLRQRAAQGYASAELYAAADSIDQYVAELQAKVDQIQAYNILTVTEVGGSAYSISSFGLSQVDNMIAATMLGLSDEITNRETYFKTGSWPLRTMAQKSQVNPSELRRSFGWIFNLSDYLQSPHVKLFVAYMGALATVGAYLAGSSLAPWVAAAYTLYLVVITGAVEVVKSTWDNLNKEDGYIDVGLTVVKNGVKALSTMLGAAGDSGIQWLANAYNNGSLVYDGVKAYFDVTGGGGGGGGGGGSDPCYAQVEGEQLLINGSATGSTEDANTSNPNRYRVLVREDGWLKITLQASCQTYGSYGHYNPDNGCSPSLHGYLTTGSPTHHLAGNRRDQIHNHLAAHLERMHLQALCELLFQQAVTRRPGLSNVRESGTGGGIESRYITIDLGYPTLINWQKFEVPAIWRGPLVL